jgi:hypothetical protein
MPTEPEPAYKSRNRAPAIRGARTLKSVSRSRSLLGRVAIPGGACKTRERNVPAMMRIANQHTNRPTTGEQH